MTDGGYNQFCPVAMAAEVLGARWTLLLLRELVSGSTRFNDLRRGVPRMSPALLSKRLKELESAGTVSRAPVSGEPGLHEYRLTDAGRELKPVIEAISCWGQRWIDLEASLEKLDPNLLMCDMRRNINPTPMPPARSTIQVIFTDLPQTRRNWWLVVEPDREVDLCSVDPGFDVDLYLSRDLRTMTEIWMGYTAIDRAKEKGKLLITGDRQLEADIGSWMSLSPFARVREARSLNLPSPKNLTPLGRRPPASARLCVKRNDECLFLCRFLDAGLPSDRSRRAGVGRLRSAPAPATMEGSEGRAVGGVRDAACGSPGQNDFLTSAKRKASGDHLDPNDAGYESMAASVDLGMLGVK